MRDGQPPGGGASTGTLIVRLAGQIRRLAGYEAQLAVAEVRAKARRAGVGIGVLGVGAVFALLGMMTLTACAVLALALVLAPWLAALVVAAAQLVMAGGLVPLGALLLRRGLPVPRETAANVKDDLVIIRRAAQR